MFSETPSERQVRAQQKLIRFLAEIIAEKILEENGYCISDFPKASLTDQENTDTPEK
ncbi:hypothetical protein NB640_11095 [Oxalobacter vibrioformis]|uniref:Uncharacterized protein n=1 Tax=Oxalobacter vibrioformis TaxID=933080 RepID=A0A9E9LZJ8_9BURK|nr:hypothetical protein [Oxalobacter vibrioformis]WAW09758.1 hypothetical protein NB640_11095 [Oxalobacter vibrioformis]